MPKDPTKKPPANVATESHPNLEEEIRRRAYELFEARGREDGHDDWLGAKGEISATTAKTAAGNLDEGRVALERTPPELSADISDLLLQSHLATPPLTLLWS